MREHMEQSFRAVELHLKESPNGLTCVELARKCLYSRWTINDWLKRMEVQGRVVRPRKNGGRWRLPGYPKDFQ